jgi:hypothetical protein
MIMECEACREESRHIDGPGDVCPACWWEQAEPGEDDHGASANGGATIEEWRMALPHLLYAERLFPRTSRLDLIHTMIDRWREDDESDAKRTERLTDMRASGWKPPPR